MIRKAISSLSRSNYFTSLPKYYQSYSKANVQIYIKDTLLTMHFPFLTGSKLFYVNGTYTFSALKEALELELQAPVEMEGQDSLNSNLFKYLLTENKLKHVKIYTSDQEFTMMPASQHREADLIKTSTQLAKSPLPLYLDMIQKGVDPSHANTLSWLLNQVNPTSNLTTNEFTQKLRQGLNILQSPIKDRLYELQHSINMLEAELCKLMNAKELMQWEAQQAGYRWLTLILFLSVLQIAGFYYGIYQVEEWGWDVCEPVTYTFQCFSVLLGMVFYMRYRQQREIETIRNAFVLRRQTKTRAWKERWSHLNNLITLKETQKHQLELQKMIFYNRMNYHYYVQEIKKRQ